MNINAFDHIFRRCAQLYKRRGTARADSEYEYWIEWLKDQLREFEKVMNTRQKGMASTKRRVLALMDKHPEIKEALGY